MKLSSDAASAGVGYALRPRLTVGDRELLDAWSRLARDRLARRADFVLRASAGESIENLSRASGVPSQRIVALLSGFASCGVLALLDAPRRGRPRMPVAASPHETVAPTSAFSAQLDPVRVRPDWRGWRDRREAALNDDRHRRRLEWPPAVASGPLSQVRAFAIGPAVSVLLVQPAPLALASGGRWLYPRLDLLMDSRAALHDAPDWRFLLERVRVVPGEPDKTRAVTERRRAWLEEALGPLVMTCGSPPRTILIGGDPSTDEFRAWMMAVRPFCDPVLKAEVALRVAGCGTLATWRDEIAQALGLPQGATRSRLSDPVADLTWCAPAHLWWVASHEVRRHGPRSPGAGE